MDTADLLLPSGVAYVLFAAGIVSALLPTRRIVSWWLLAASGATTLVFSSGFVAAALMSPLEYWKPRLVNPEEHPQARHIVVLTAWGSDDQNLPLTGRINASSLYRVALAVELYLARPDCDVIVSGDSVTATLMRKALEQFGVPESQITIEGKSLSTAESAGAVRALLGSAPFFLVTSAGHMPRAVAAFEKQGLTPIAAPTDHQFPQDWRRANGTPRSSALAVSDLAVHEWLGLAWYRLTNRT